MQCTNEALKLSDFFGGARISSIQFRMVFLDRRREAGFGWYTKDTGVVDNESFDVGLCTIAQCPIRVTEEVSSKMVLGLTNALEFVVVRWCLECIHEHLWLFHGH